MSLDSDWPKIVSCPECGSEHKIAKEHWRQEVECTNCASLFFGDEIWKLFVDEFSRGVMPEEDPEIVKSSNLSVYGKFQEPLRQAAEADEVVKRIWRTGNGILAYTSDRLILIEDKGPESSEQGMRGKGVLGTVLSVGFYLMTKEIKVEPVPLGEVTGICVSEGKLVISTAQYEVKTAGWGLEGQPEILKELRKIPELYDIGGKKDGLLDKLEKLGQLYNDGVLTKDEFEKQKARLLE